MTKRLDDPAINTEWCEHWRDSPVDTGDEELARAIRRLAAGGAKVRDICSLLSLHPLIITRALAQESA